MRGLPPINRENGLIYTANSAQAPGAKESIRMDFKHEDRADGRRLNVILWKGCHGIHACAVDDPAPT
jgi:hypothetical protein